MLKFTPHQYQLEPQELLANNDAFGLFMFPGAGKTPLMLEKLYQNKEPTLIVAPLDIMYTTWHKEPTKWEFSQTLKMVVLHGPDKDANFHKKAGVYLINPEGLKWLVNKVQATGRFPWTTLIIDESSKFKNHKSERFKYLTKILKSFKRRYIMSGNPVPNHYLDIWAQIFILDCGKRLGTSWYAFKDKYFYPTDYNRFNWALKPGSKEEIISQIADVTFFLDPSSELDLPKRTEIDHELVLPQSAMKQYKEMQDQLFYALSDTPNESEVLLASNATTAAIKCWQIANGFIYETTEEGRKTHQIHDVLIRHTMTLVESMQGSPVLVAYNFLEDLERLKAAFPTARIVASGATPKEIQAAETDWNKDKIEILVVHINKFSHGLNLQYGSGCQILFYGLTYNFDVYDQLIRRFERQGAKYREVIVHRLIVKDTVHKAIVETLGKKESMSSDFLNSLREYRDSLLN